MIGGGILGAIAGAGSGRIQRFETTFDDASVVHGLIPSWAESYDALVISGGEAGGYNDDQDASPGGRGGNARYILGAKIPMLGELQADGFSLRPGSGGHWISEAAGFNVPAPSELEFWTGDLSDKEDITLALRAASPGGVALGVGGTPRAGGNGGGGGTSNFGGGGGGSAGNDLAAGTAGATANSSTGAAGAPENSGTMQNGGAGGLGGGRYSSTTGQDGQWPGGGGGGQGGNNLVSPGSGAVGYCCIIFRGDGNGGGT